MPQICDIGQTALLPFRRKACWGLFSPLKIRRLRPGLNPRTWVPKASTLPLDHRSRSPLSGLFCANRFKKKYLEELFECSQCACHCILHAADCTAKVRSASVTALSNTLLARNTWLAYPEVTIRNACVTAKPKLLYILFHRALRNAWSRLRTTVVDLRQKDVGNTWRNAFSSLSDTGSVTLLTWLRSHFQSDDMGNGESRSGHIYGSECSKLHAREFICVYVWPD